MRRMERALSLADYVVVNKGYPSREHRIEVLAPLAIETGLDECRRRGADSRVHFVTHSLGGILVRYYTEEKAIAGLGRVVMLGPPNQGSLAADKWRGMPGFNALNGPAGSQLGKGEDSVPLQLGAPDFEFGVIAGDRSIDPITSAMLPNPDDGRVSVDDTKLDGMRDFRVVHASHAFMMRDRDVIEMTKNFLARGFFSSAADSEDVD